MMKQIPYGLTDFGRIQKENYYYVDKTLMIRDFLDKKPMVSLFTRPRRFGKSYTANMLAAYYSKEASSEEMFSDLEIGKTEDFVFSY